MECPQCNNHCDASALSCHRGEEYFKSQGLEYKRKEKKVGEHHHHHHHHKEESIEKAQDPMDQN